MEIGINDLDFDEFDETTTQDIIETEDDTPVNEEPVETPIEEPISEKPVEGNVLYEFLKSKGIQDVSKIKYENEEGEEEEVSWDTLESKEQLAILNQLTSSESDLDASEIELINAIRNSKMTPSEYLDYNVQAGVQRYIQNNTEQGSNYEIDQFSDDEIFLMDLLARIGQDNITQEEALELLDKTKTNGELFKKQVNAIRSEYKKLEETTWIELNSITPNHLLENLQPSTDYEFRVQADCGAEQSLWSDVFVFTTTTLVLPPENLRVDSYSYNTAKISWEDNLGAESYQVETLLTTNNTTSIQQTNLNTIELPQLLPNSIYQIKVKTVAPTGDTSLSSDVYLHTLCYPTEEFPYFVEDTISFSTQTSFCNFDDCWRVEADTLFSPLFNINSLSNPYLTFDYSSLQFISSQLFVSIDGGTMEEIDFNIANGYNQLSLLGYQGNETIRFAIQSQMYNNEEQNYTINNFSIKDTCLSPNGVTVNQITYFSARIEWQTIDNITQYDLKIINTQNSDTLSFNNVESGFVVEDLIPMQEYKVILYSTCGLQQALNFVEEYFTTTSQSETCLMPQNFECQHFQVKGDETIVCTWDEVEDNPYIQWEIQYKERLAVNYTSAIVSLYPRFTLRNLEMGSQWDFRVRAICSVGDTSSWTPVVQVTVGEQSLQANQYSGKTVKIYPNPTDSILYIETEAIELKEAQMIDSYGRVIRAWDILPREIDVTTMEAGTYVLKFLMDNQPVTRKITIQ